MFRKLPGYISPNCVSLRHAWGLSCDPPLSRLTGNYAGACLLSLQGRSSSDTSAAARSRRLQRHAVDDHSSSHAGYLGSLLAFCDAVAPQYQKITRTTSGALSLPAAASPPHQQAAKPYATEVLKL